MKETKSLYKIYSRKRLELFKPPKKKRYKPKSKDGKMIYVVCVFVIGISYLIFTKSIEPIFETICLNEAKAVATEVTSYGSSKAMENFQYGDIFSIEKDNNRKHTNDKCRYYNNRQNNFRCCNLHTRRSK